MTTFLPNSRTLRTVLSALLPCSVAACGGDSHDDPPPLPSYALSGSVSHLDTGSLTISDGTETLTIGQGSTSFSFGQPIATGTAYSVTVTTQPSGENCVVENGSGTVSGSDVRDISIVCNTVISQPVALGVLPVAPSASSAARIFLPVSMVGNATVAINAILDTGSAGTVLNALNIFPSSIVSAANGFVFTSGQSSIAYSGITVTSLKLTRLYGAQGSSPTLLTGNLGFAQLTFGSGTRVTTAVVPIFFAYQSCRAASSSTCDASGQTAPGNFGNLIGVAPGIAPFPVVGSTPPATLSPCTPQSTSTCGALSPFRYLTYANGTDDGFVLKNVTLAACSIDTSGSCREEDALFLGVNSSSSSGFATTALASCGTVAVTGSISEPACSQVIPNVMVSSGGVSYTGSAIFDSGYPTIRLSVPRGSPFLATFPAGRPAPVGTPFTVGITVPPATNPAFAYQFVAGTGYLSTQVVENMAATDYTNSGIAFFTLNSFLVDYSKGIEGWRSGS